MWRLPGPGAFPSPWRLATTHRRASPSQGIPLRLTGLKTYHTVKSEHTHFTSSIPMLYPNVVVASCG
eukprot:1142362-Pelagomonas_calceolata.AAC.13